LFEEYGVVLSNLWEFKSQNVNYFQSSHHQNVDPTSLKKLSEQFYVDKIDD